MLCIIPFGTRHFENKLIRKRQKGNKTKRKAQRDIEGENFPSQLLIERLSSVLRRFTTATRPQEKFQRIFAHLDVNTELFVLRQSEIERLQQKSRHRQQQKAFLIEKCSEHKIFILIGRCLVLQRNFLARFSSHHQPKVVIKICPPLLFLQQSTPTSDKSNLVSVLCEHLSLFIFLSKS